MASIETLLRRVDEGGSSWDRKKGQGRKMSEQRKMVAEKVKKTLAEDEPNANHSLRKIAKRESISRSTAQRILRKDLGVKSVRKIRG